MLVGGLYSGNSQMKEKQNHFCKIQQSLHLCQAWRVYHLLWSKQVSWLECFFSSTYFLIPFAVFISCLFLKSLNKEFTATVITSLNTSPSVNSFLCFASRWQTWNDTSVEIFPFAAGLIKNYCCTFKTGFNSLTFFVQSTLFKGKLSLNLPCIVVWCLSKFPF